MTTGRGKTTKSPLNQGKKEVKTLGEKETRQDRRAGKDNLRQGYLALVVMILKKQNYKEMLKKELVILIIKNLKQKL